MICLNILVACSTSIPESRNHLRIIPSPHLFAAEPQDGGITEILPQPLREDSQRETTVTVAPVCARHVSICPQPGAGGYSNLQKDRNWYDPAGIVINHFSIFLENTTILVPKWVQGGCPASEISCFINPTSSIYHFIAIPNELNQETFHGGYHLVPKHDNEQLSCL